MREPIRIAVIDSGVDPCHVKNVTEGVGIRVAADRAVLDRQWHDELGHGTLVAAVVSARCPEATIVPVRLFRRKLIAPVTGFVAAIDWAASSGVPLACLSVPVSKLQWRPSFEEAVARAVAAGTLIVAPAEVSGSASLPGCLPGVLGIRADDSVGDAFSVEDTVVLTSAKLPALPPRPRATIPSPDALATAAVTGALATWFSEALPGGEREALAFFASEGG